ncbi:GNAT family N-acetyltransferase [Candidatus Bipolaricaulota bacterium]
MVPFQAGVDRDIEILKATKSDSEELRKTLVQAFRDDPFFDWFIPQGDAHDQRLGHLIGWFLERAFQQGTVWTVPDMSAAILVMPPGAWELSIMQQLAELPIGIREFGARRLVQRVAGIAALEKRAPTAPHYYVPLLGTIPSHRGRGIGSALLQAALRLADSEGAPTYLENTNELNLHFYQQSGFLIRELFKMSRRAPAMWQLWREPQAGESLPEQTDGARSD